MAEKQGQESRIDARVISLYSKGTTDNRLDFNNIYISYMYYLAIDVKPANTKPEHPFWEDSPLLAAYTSWSDRSIVTLHNQPNSSDAFRQTIMAFTDVDKTGKDGYTQDEINAFWDDMSPILFISMVNIKDEKTLGNTIQKFRGCDRTMVYFTFDNCDLILFHKDNRFDNYVDLLFQFCFQKTNPSVVDCMTLYGFRFDESTKNTDEKFDVMLRYGIEDYSKLPECFRRTSIRPSGLILGRSDGTTYYRDVQLEWLAKCVRWLGDENGNNLHNIDLMVIIPPKENSETVQDLSMQFGKTAPRLLGKEDLLEKVRKLWQDFDESYRAVFSGDNRLEVDGVLLRWLRDSCELACELYNNTLSSDIGICLLPQYVNLFTYFDSVFQRHNDLIEYKENINNCFIAFFNSMLTLMDSMNHSDRQFVQAPSFHSTSFEMPPKLLACLTAATQYLVTALNDNEHHHCFTISPRFAQELDVTPLTVKDDGTDNMLSIGIGESRMYTIAHTILIIAHEISHFVGGDNRCRKKRRESIIKTGIHLLLNALINRLSPEDEWQNLSKEEMKLRSERFKGKAVENAVNLVYQALYDNLPEDYGSDDTLYLREVNTLLCHLPDAIGALPAVSDIVIKYVIEAFFDYSFFTSNNKSGYEAAWHKRIGSQITGRLDADAKMGILRSDILDWYYEQIKIKKGYFIQQEIVSELNGQQDTDKMPLGQFICYMFSETFSDLQTILLFKLSLRDYLRMLIYIDGKYIRDLSPRLLAVAKTMYGNKGWKDADITTLNKIEELNEVPWLWDTLELVTVNPCNDSDTYGRKKINAILIRYLTDYLKECKSKILKFLNKNDNENVKLARVRLRSLFRKVRGDNNDNSNSNISVCQLEKEMIKFLRDFTKTFEDNLP